MPYIYALPILDVTLSLTKSAYNTSESTGFVTVCAKILNGTLGRSINVYASTIDGTATGLFQLKSKCCLMYS